MKIIKLNEPRPGVCCDCGKDGKLWYEDEDAYIEWIRATMGSEDYTEHLYCKECAILRSI